ncbi:MAG: Lrp/AsnC family transcriptional regulator [Desulfobacter sp.]|nr:Lrp/AsnC family transcriptional regulator [Desulfobacter sp.]WDP86901.1 MAG: Lrp/AsnC family transcriptional regulator [Desulfobacter sp.]
MTLDQANINLAGAPEKGRTSFKESAGDIGIPEKTVGARVERFRKENFLNIYGPQYPAGMPGHQILIICIQLWKINPGEKGEKRNRLQDGITVSAATGRYELIVRGLFKKGFASLILSTRNIWTSHGLSSVGTFAVYTSYDF